MTIISPFTETCTLSKETVKPYQPITRPFKLAFFFCLSSVKELLLLFVFVYALLYCINMLHSSLVKGMEYHWLNVFYQVIKNEN